jgi:hypothetical protein
MVSIQYFGHSAPNMPLSIGPASNNTSLNCSSSHHHAQRVPCSWCPARARVLMQQVASSAQRPIQHFPLPPRPSTCLAVVRDRGRASWLRCGERAGKWMLPQHSTRREVESAEPCWMARSLSVARRFPEWLLPVTVRQGGLRSECNPKSTDQRRLDPSCPSKQGRGMRLKPAELESSPRSSRRRSWGKYCVHATRHRLETEDARIFQVSRYHQ